MDLNSLVVGKNKIIIINKKIFIVTNTCAAKDVAFAVAAAVLQSKKTKHLFAVVAVVKNQKNK